nr:MAG: coat protein [Wufeng shrew permutotetravirus 15]
MERPLGSLRSAGVGSCTSPCGWQRLMPKQGYHSPLKLKPLIHVINRIRMAALFMQKQNRSQKNSMRRALQRQAEVSAAVNLAAGMNALSLNGASRLAGAAAGKRVRFGKRSKQGLMQFPGMVPLSGVKMSKSARRRARMRARLNAAEAFDPLSAGEIRLRSGPGVNPADPRTDRALTELGNTGNGRSWCLKALHPNGEGINMVPKFPDGSVTTSVVLQRADRYDLKSPFTTDLPLWNVLIIDFPFLGLNRVAIAHQTADITDILLQDAVMHILNKQPYSASSFFYPEWADPLATTAASGRLLATILCPKVLYPDDGLSNWFGTLKEVRRTYYGSTIDLNASALTDQGTATAGQFPPDVGQQTRSITELIGDPKEEVVTSTYDVFTFTLPPMTVDGIVATDQTQKYQDLAKEGLYTPLRYWSSNVPFTPISNARYVEAAHESGVVPTNFAGDVRKDIFLAGFGTSVSLFNGLDKSASLSLKVNEGLELVPSVGSLYSPFLSPGFSSDARARDLCQEFARSSPHHYPADFNHSNGILGSIIGGLGSAIGNLGIPIISDIVGGLGDLIGGLLPF